MTEFRNFFVQIRDSWARMDQPLMTAFLFAAVATFASLVVIVTATWNMIDHLW